MSHCDLYLPFPGDQRCPSTFLCTFWPSVCLLWENVYSVLLSIFFVVVFLLSIFKLDLFFFFLLLSCMSSLDINPLSDIIYHLNRGREESALRGKQTAFRKDKWALRRIDGRSERIVIRSV